MVVSLRDSQTLAKAQIQGVVHLVSSSVEGLQARDVTVVDGHGHLLSNTMTDETAGLSSTQMEYQRTMEKDIETRIQTMLERIVGANKAVVRVSSVLDFSKIETTEERYDPNGQVVTERTTRAGKIQRCRTALPAACPASSRMCRAVRRQRAAKPVRTTIRRKMKRSTMKSAGPCPASWSRRVQLRICRWPFWWMGPMKAAKPARTVDGDRQPQEVRPPLRRRNETDRRHRQESDGLFHRTAGSS